MMYSVIAAWYDADDLAHDSPKHSTIIRIIRYQATISRQLFQAVNERLQRLRKGEEVPAPLNLQVSHGTSPISDLENSETISVLRRHRMKVAYDIPYRQYCAFRSISFRYDRKTKLTKRSQEPIVRQCDRLFAWTGIRHCTSAR